MCVLSCFYVIRRVEWHLSRAAQAGACVTYFNKVLNSRAQDRDQRNAAKRREKLVAVRKRRAKRRKLQLARVARGEAKAGSGTGAGSGVFSEAQRLQKSSERMARIRRNDVRRQAAEYIQANIHGARPVLRSALYGELECATCCTSDIWFV